MAEHDMIYQQGEASTKIYGPFTWPIDRTLRKNIDMRIATAEAEVKKLQDMKARLEASGLLDTHIEDLQQAMRW